VNYVKPDGGLFLWVDLSFYMKKKLGVNDFWVWNKIFNDYGVNISPGYLFGSKDYTWFRICCIQEEFEVVEGMNRLEKFLKENF